MSLEPSRNEEHVSVAKCVRKRINEKFAKLYREDEVGEYAPHVCLICDEFVKADHLS